MTSRIGSPAAAIVRLRSGQGCAGGGGRFGRGSNKDGGQRNLGRRTALQKITMARLSAQDVSASIRGSTREARIKRSTLLGKERTQKPLRRGLRMGMQRKSRSGRLNAAPMASRMAGPRQKKKKFNSFFKKKSGHNWDKTELEHCAPPCHVSSQAKRAATLPCCWPALERAPEK